MERCAKALAFRFAVELRRELGPGEFLDMQQRNKTAPRGICHSHDFCDANMVMANAWAQLGYGANGVEVSSEEDQALSNEAWALWNEAWDMAKYEYLGGVK